MKTALTLAVLAIVAMVMAISGADLLASIAARSILAQSTFLPAAYEGVATTPSGHVALSAARRLHSAVPAYGSPAAAFRRGLAA